MGTGSGNRAGEYRERDSVLGLDSPSERLVCMYLERVPAASAADIERDLRLPREALLPVLESLVERGFIRERDGLYVLSVGSVQD